MTAAITIQGVSKLYHIGRHRWSTYGTLRESIMHAAASPWRWFTRQPDRQGEACENNELWALKDVSLEVDEGEVLAIVGRNGAGKSTLLKILSRIVEPTTGRASVRGKVGSLLEVGTGFHPELTGRENVYLNGAILGMSRREIDQKFDAIVAFSEIERFLDTPVKRYSSGMYTRLAFSVASYLEPEILILDEVLSVGDAAFQKKCLKRIDEVSRDGRTVLFVSHNMAAVKALCDRAVLFECGRLVLDGNVDEVVDRYIGGVSERAAPLAEGGIPAEAVRLSDSPGEAHIHRVRLTNLDSEETKHLRFGEPFRVGMTIDIFKEVEDPLFEISVSTLDGQQVTYSTIVDDGTPPSRVLPGTYEVWAEFESPLLPRQYTISAGLHHYHGGGTVEFIPRTLEFTVMRSGYGNREPYRWGEARGLVRLPGKWELQPAAIQKVAELA